MCKIHFKSVPFCKTTDHTNGFHSNLFIYNYTRTFSKLCGYKYDLEEHSVVLSHGRYDVRGRSDKYLSSPPEGAIIAREIYYRVVHSRRRLLSKFQSNRTRSFVLSECGNGRYKNGKKSVGDSILVLGR